MTLHIGGSLMKPGISGLWQVSGRSDLEWDDAIRLDLYYVENWSIVSDIAILWRTIRAVDFAGKGRQLMAGVIVHEWIEKAGGAEKVLDAMINCFPNADLRVLWNDAHDRYDGRTIAESWISRTPLRKRKALALPSMPMTWRNLPAGKSYKWMLVSSHLFAHHAKFRGLNKKIPKLVYAHTPARYIWTPELDQRGRSGIARVGSRALKPLDKRRAAEGGRGRGKQRVRSKPNPRHMKMNWMRTSSTRRWTQNVFERSKTGRRGSCHPKPR